MQHYFSKKQDSEPNIKKIRSRLRHLEFEFYVASGVFSKSKVDKGSELLINSAIIEDGWKVLDLGCGYGPVGIAINKAYPTTGIKMADINERAVKLTRRNITLNKVEAKVFQSDLFEKIEDKFNTIIVNPPQKAGKDTCFKLIEESKDHLLKDGLLQLVARHQKGGKPLEKKMKEVFGNVEAIAKKGGYRVYISKN
ncbi:MAG: class I SAM-dependent methyltransferase [Nanoarchaeota archaeon]